MPISWRYDRARGYIVGRLTDPFDLDDIQSLLSALNDAKDFPPGTPELWDARELDFAKLNRAFEERVVELQKQSPPKAARRIAVVIADDLGYGMMRMYQALSNELPQECQAFRDVDEAERWLLGGSPADRSPPEPE